MFCPKCGQELIPQTRFCAHCGADIQSLLQQTGKTPSTSQENMPEIHEPKNDLSTPDISAQEIFKARLPETKPKVLEVNSKETGSPQRTSGDDCLAAVDGKTQAYCPTEFQKIRTGEKSRFNRAAFYIVAILLVALIGGAGILAVWHQHSAISKPDTPGRFDMSDIQGSLADTSGSPSQSIDVPFGDVGQFDDFVGVWEREGSGGGYLLISYEDETAQRAYAEVVVGNIYFVAELTRISDESIYGVSLEDEYEIDLSQNGSELDAAIFYSDKLIDYISFAPGGFGDEINDPNSISQSFDPLVGDWFCDESLVGLFIGYKDETKQVAYGAILTLEDEYYDIEMWTDDGETIEGLLMGYGSEPELALTLTYDGYGLGGSIYYGASGIEEDVYFTPYESPGFQNPYYTS